jgi:protein-tyrosine phosphatase
VIDLHSHVLPGIDDGPETFEGSIALAGAASAGGVRTLLATPHVSPRYPNDAATIAELVEGLNRQLVEGKIDVEVRAGAEIALTRVAELDREELGKLTLGGGPWLLVEPPFTPAVRGLDRMLLDVAELGHKVVIAHPERCPAFHHDRAALESLVEKGLLTSITAGSLVGRFGGTVKRFALELVRDGLVHNVASDAHGLGTRAPGIADELDRAGLGGLTEWLTCEVPAAILAGGTIPAAPSGAIARLRPRRSWPWRRA